MIKSNTLGFSFGYLVLDATKRQGGGRVLNEIDVFEISTTHTPVNGATRVLAWKSADASREPPTLDQLRRQEADLGLGDPKMAKLRTEMRDAMLVALGCQPFNPDIAGGSEPKSLTATALREKCRSIEAAFAPVTIAVFEC